MERRKGTKYIGKEQAETPVSPLNNTPETTRIYDHRQDQYLAIKTQYDLEPEKVLHINNEQLDISLNDIFLGAETLHTTQNKDVSEVFRENDIAHVYSDNPEHLNIEGDIVTIYNHQGSPMELIEDKVSDGGWVFTDDTFGCASALFEEPSLEIMGVAPMKWKEGDTSYVDEFNIALYLESFRDNNVDEWGDSKKEDIRRCVSRFVDEYVEDLEGVLSDDELRLSVPFKRKPGDVFVYKMVE